MNHTEQATVVGTIQAEGSTGLVRMQDRYDTGIEDLWSAVTTPDRLARWVADVTGDLRLGGTFHATFTSGWDGPGRVDVCAAPHHLQLTMSPGTAEETVIEAQLSVDGDGTRLVVEERGLPRAELPAHGAGWQVHVEDLAAHLAGRERGDWHERWVALSPGYREQADEG
jgi:uncharacterized protein YndB with AHSA1/START domain